MDDQRWQRADEIFSAALELPPAERTAYVQRAAAGDEELEALALRLLGHAEDSGDDIAPGLRLGSPPVLQLLEDDPAEALPSGTVVGRYRLVEEIGRGGMAVVYRAERVDGDFEHQVALKRIRGPVSQELVRRFEQERQILARATHPDIARLLDGGIDGDGFPYLVMELVEGMPIDQYCDAQRLTIGERLRLFLRVAQAVQYAHRNLVIHRDIKPSNILVTADGHPKLLDFGIALLLDGPTGAGFAPLTQELRPMTPAYASPEQIRREPVNTLSDIYQLGLLLYLLLTGRTPYRQQSSRSPLDLARAITEEPPAHPQLAFLNPERHETDAPTGTTVAKIAERRRIAPARLARQLRGDLGQIVLMALRKEPERRYASIALMADDLERYLAGRTVAARADSPWYRFRTFARRHRVAVQIAALLVISLVVFSAVTAVQAHRIAAQRDRANREAQISASVASFLTELFQLFDPSETRGNTVTAREILDRGSSDIDRRMPEPTLERARLKRTMGNVYENLGLYRDALPLYRQALLTGTEISGVSGKETLDAQGDLARLLARLGQYEEAEALTLATLESLESRLGTEDPETLEVQSTLASLHFFAGRPKDAEALYRQILERRGRVLGKEHPDTLATAISLASVFFYQGRREDAEALYRETFEKLTRILGPDHPQTLKVASNLGSIWVQLGRFAEAEPLLRSTIAGRARVLGAEHPATLTARANLAGLLADRGALEEAEDIYRDVYAGRRKALGATHSQTLGSLCDLAWVASLTPSRTEEAIVIYKEALAGYEAIFQDGHPMIPDTLYSIAVLEARAGRDDAALGHLQTALERGYRSKALLEEPAFERLAHRPAMQKIQAEVRERRGLDPAPPDQNASS